LGDATLDAIDELVPPGTVVDENDRGFSPCGSKRQRAVASVG